MPSSDASLNEARRYATEQATIAATTSSRVAALWRSMTRGHSRLYDAAQAFGTVAPSVLEAGQDSAVRSSDVYLARYLSIEDGRRIAPLGLEPSQFHGVAGADAGAGAALSSAVARSLAYSHGIGFTVDQAVEHAEAAAGRLVRNEVRVAGRASVALLIDGREIKGRPRVSGYTRITTGAGSCLACIGASGKTFATGETFRYHPGCGCVAVPIVSGRADTVKPPSGRELFDRLSTAEQDRAFGRATADLVRKGAPLDDFAVQDGRYFVQATVKEATT